MSSVHVDGDGLTRFRVDQVMHDFRDALIAVAPVLTRTGIDVGVDDDWDTISEALFDAIVLSPIRYSGYVDGIEFNKYGFTFDSYGARPYFVVRDSARPGERFIFVDIAPGDTFSTVRARTADGPLADVVVPWSRASFSLRIPGRHDELQEMTYC